MARGFMVEPETKSTKGMTVGRYLRGGKRRQMMTRRHTFVPTHPPPTAEFFSILKPYYWPEANKDKVAAMSCFSALVLSKLANIWGPLFLGKAVSQMGDGSSFM
jgi:hypothetical protein